MGILLLLILASTLQPIELKIKDITLKYLDKKIQAEGKIINIKTYKNQNFQLLTIQDNSGKIEITLNKIQNLTKAQTITVIGTVRQYENNLQIQAGKIMKD